MDNIQKINYYSGLITPEKNTIFVFGSNPNGIHRSGSAKVALEQFGARYGQGEGIQGNAYALPTKDINKTRGTRMHRPGKREEKELNQWIINTFLTGDSTPCPLNRSVSKDAIISSIIKMYQVAQQMPTRLFKVAYTNDPDKITLCGYVGFEMIAMFVEASKHTNGIPSNVVFSENWKPMMEFLSVNLQ